MAFYGHTYGCAYSAAVAGLDAIANDDGGHGSGAYAGRTGAA